MNSNILFLPFRKSHTVSLADAIKQYISSKYDQHPDMFADDLDRIDRLRANAIHSMEPHVSGVRKLQAYAAQLVWLSGKFPIDIGVEFPWCPALGYNKARSSGYQAMFLGALTNSSAVSQNNLKFELANVLFNLAAMYSQLATHSNRSTSEGLKAACNQFCAAAGVIAHIKTEVLPELRTSPPEDMDTMTLESVQSLLLAQAQECFWQKAVKDGLKDAIIAKLAAKVSDFYSDAADYGIKSDAISSEWIHHMTAKHHHFAAAAQYRAACDCLEKRKYGEEVARLRDSLVCVNEALREARYIKQAVLADLNGLKMRVQEDLKRAEKDNDMIYLLPVPPKPELKTLDRASMVSAKAPKEVSDPIPLLGMNSELGPPLFTKLVPYSVHVAASIYADRRDKLVNGTIIDELEGMTAQIHDVLKSLNLPGSLQALEKPLGLPSGLLAHAEEIRQQDGILRLQRSMEETRRLKESDRAIYEEGVDILRAEANEDDAARTKYGTANWTRLPSAQAAPRLHAQIGEIDGYFRSAANSDGLVEAKLRENEHHIRLLGGPESELEQFVPSSRRPMLTPAVEKESGRLRAYLNEINRTDSRRRRKIEQLRHKAKQDDIGPDLLKEAARLEREYPLQSIEAVQFEELFRTRLRLYDVDRAMVTEEAREQQELIRKVAEAHGAFTAARRGDQSTRQREQALQALENAYFKYKEIIANLDVGRKFYNDLAKIVTRFRDEARTFAYSRRAEAAQVETDLTTQMSGLHLQQQQQQQQQQQSHHQQQAQPTHANQLRQQASPYRNPPSANETPLPSAPTPAPAPALLASPPPPSSSSSGAPIPTAGMWNPAMGIRFAGSGSPAPSPAPASASGAATAPANGGVGSGLGSGFGAGAGAGQQATWDPLKGLRLG